MPGLSDVKLPPLQPAGKAMLPVPPIWIGVGFTAKVTPEGQAGGGGGGGGRDATEIDPLKEQPLAPLGAVKPEAEIVAVPWARPTTVIPETLAMPELLDVKALPPDQPVGSKTTELWLT